MPVADAAASWRVSLVASGALALVGLLAWLPVVRRVNDHDDPDERDPRQGLPWRSATAWTVAAYLALQSCGFYSQLAWLSPSYEARGWSAASAGMLLALFSVTQIVSGVAGPALSDRTRDRRPVIAGFVVMSICGLLGMVVAPDTLPWLWVMLLALGQGGGFALGLVLLVDHAPDPAGSARLSAMAFSISYSVAAAGPVVFGVLRDATRDFTVPWTVLIAMACVQLAVVARLRPVPHGTRALAAARSTAE
ncbi:MAG: MFS transporter [Actinomycetota bacterium]|nr:MFS transporter [Actinomycetota bacterium]